MASGPADAKGAIVEYAAPTCPHCARFNKDVFTKTKSEYVDTGKVRYVFRNFPLNIKDLACEMPARNIAKDDPEKYFAEDNGMFRRQQELVESTRETPRRTGREVGRSVQA